MRLVETSPLMKTPAAMSRPLSELPGLCRFPGCRHVIEATGAAVYCVEHTLRRAVQLHRLAVPWTAIAEMLNAEGLRTPDGGPWSAQLVEASVQGELGPSALSAWTLRRLRRRHELEDERTPRPAANGQRAAELTVVSQAARRGVGLHVSRTQLPAEARQYLEVLSASASSSTVTAGALALRRLCAYLDIGADGPLCARLDRASLSGFQRGLADAVPWASTRAGYLGGLRQFLRYACAEGWLPRDLSGHVVLPRIPERHVGPIPTPLVIPMLRGLPRANLLELRDRALVHFLLSTGCRLGEALAVQRADYNPRGTRVRGFKAKRMRTVYLFDEAALAVTEYLEARGDDPCPALFVDVDGRRSKRRHPLTGDGARRVLTRLRRGHPEIPGLAHLTHWHVLRHTLATALLEATHDVRLLQEVLGHQTMRTIAIYAEVTDQRKRAAYASGGRLARLLHAGTS